MHLTWNEFQADCERMARRIRMSGTVYDRILCIARGGVFVGGLLAHLLDYRNLTTIALKLYKGRAPGEAVELVSRPDLPPPGSRILVVDDLLDSGRTFAYINDHYRRDFRLHFAALYDKGGGDFRPDFTAREIADDWVVFPWEDAGIPESPSGRFRPVAATPAPAARVPDA